MLFWRRRLSVSSKQGDVTPYLPAFRLWRGKTAKLMTSVCTGSMVLGAAGLLRGYKATSHWPVRDILPQLGAELAVNRVVQDRSAA